MKATGIVRRIDDLGRVVIPKEIRRTMRIREGDPLEIFTNAEGEVIFKKYSVMEGSGRAMQIYADALSKATGKAAGICDRDTVLAVCGLPKREYADKSVSDALSDLMQRRTRYAHRSGEKARVPLTGERSTAITAAEPIVSGSDCVGAVVLLSDGDAPCSSEDMRLCTMLSQLLGGVVEA